MKHLAQYLENPDASRNIKSLSSSVSPSSFLKSQFHSLPLRVVPSGQENVLPWWKMDVKPFSVTVILS